MFDSPFFTLQRIAEGVYAAICREGAGAMANAAIVDLGDATLVFDTMLTHTAGADLRRAAEELTGRPVTYVVNSHWHGDHVLGNQAFAGATIIATDQTRALMAEHVVIKDRVGHRAGLEEHTRHLADQIEQERDPRKRLGMDQDREDFLHALDLIDTTEVVLPHVTVADRLVLHGSRRSAELLTYGGGHTLSDLFLYLPTEGIALLGDLAPVKTHPWLGHGSPAALLTIVDRLLMLDLKTYVAGHGLPGAPADMQAVSAYVTELQATVSRLAAEGATKADLGALPIPDLARDWGAAHVFSWNVQFLWSELTKER